MLLNNVADKLVFKFLSKINYGYLELTTFDGNVLKFGNRFRTQKQKRIKFRFDVPQMQKEA